jgi:hypothetical protein
MFSSLVGVILAVVAVGVVAAVVRVRYVRAKRERAAGWKYNELERGDPMIETPSTNGAAAYTSAPSPVEPVLSAAALEHESALTPPLPPDDTIVFPTGTGRGFGDFRMVDLPPPRSSYELPESTAISSILAGGLDELAGSGDRVADAIRERPLQYLVGALAAGFAAGLMVPALSGQHRIEKLLERLVEGQEETRRSRDV